MALRLPRVRFLPDGLTGTTGSAIICEPVSGACRPVRAVSAPPTACDVVESLEAGLAATPQRVASRLVLPAGQSAFVATASNGRMVAVGIQYEGGLLAVCGPLDWPYSDGNGARTQHIEPDDAEALGVGESLAYRILATGRLELAGVRRSDGTVVPAAS